MAVEMRFARISIDSPGYTAQDITSAVAALVQEQKLINGIVTLYAVSPRTMVVLTEYEPELLKDLEELIRSLESKSIAVAEALLGKETSAPVVKGSLEMGSFKNFVFIDLSHKPGEKEVVVILEGVFKGG